MISPKSVARFLLTFAVIFALLMLPWLRLAEGYTAIFRAVGTWCFTSQEGRREVTFVESPDRATHTTYARIEIANRDLLKPDGSGPIRHLDMDVRRSGWQPTALLLALVLASPVRWKRRISALCWGCLLLQLVAMAFLAFAIWNESSEIGLVTLSPFWKSLASEWQYNFITLFSIVAPVVVWLLLTFRDGDMAAWRRADRAKF